MEWYNILALIVGALGGVGGLISIYKARPEKESIVVKNMKEMLDEAHKLFDEIKQERDSISTEFSEYKTETDAKFISFESRLNAAESETLGLKATILRGYACKYPDSPELCPVLQEYEKKHLCDGCNCKEA